MTGVELCAMIRSQPAYRQTPIIMITAMSEKRYIDKAFTAGATDYVTKPFDFLELGMRIKLAEQLAIKSKPRRQEGRSLDSLTKQLLNPEVIHISDALPIEDVEGVLNIHAFENYLMQLNRGLFYRATVFSVKVNNISAIFDQTSAKEFKDIVIDLAEAISTALESYERFLTYLGSGIYCCVIDGRFHQEIGDLVLEFENSVFQLGLVYPNGSPLSAQFTVGQPVTPSLFTRPGSLSILQKSVENVEMKSASMDNAFSLKRWHEIRTSAPETWHR